MNANDEFIPSVEQAAVARALLPVVAEAIKNRQDVSAPLTYTLSLPEGYTTKTGPHGQIFVCKDGVALRQQVKVVGSRGLPAWFNDRTRAIAYAIEHHRLELECHQEVPGWSF